MKRENYTMREYTKRYKSNFTAEFIPTKAKTEKGIVKAINTYGQLCGGIDLIDDETDLYTEFFTICTDGVIMWSDEH